MYIDAITTLADNSKNIHEKTNTYAQDNSEIEETKMKENMYSELIKLDDLREKGILTEKEFNQQKQKILNAN